MLCYFNGVIGECLINCHKIGLSKVKDGFDMWTNSWSNFSACLLGVDEQLVHIGVQMSLSLQTFYCVFQINNI